MERMINIADEIEPMSQCHSRAKVTEVTSLFSPPPPNSTTPQYINHTFFSY